MKKIFALLMVVVMLCMVVGCVDSDSTNESDITQSNSSFLDDYNQSKDQSESKTEGTSCTHSKTIIKNKLDSTCTENGYSGDKYCASCDKLIQTGFIIKTSGHKTEVRNKKDATYISTGYTGDTYCKTCNLKLESGKTIPKLESNNQQNNSSTVCITETGKKYHSTTYCTGLNNAKAIYESTLSDAQKKGLTPCSKCY